MPTIQIDFEDFKKLLGIKLPKEADELNEMLSYVKGEVTLLNGQEVHIEIKDSNRPDLWHVEGLARALRGFLGFEKGPREYSVAGNSGAKVNVDSRLKNIRPYIACAVIKNVKLNGTIIRQALHLQDKLDQSYGRRRQRASIGLYNFSLIAPPLHYGVAKPSEASFAPLGFEEKMSLKEILEKHPKGIEYGEIVRKYALWPILEDSEGKILSFPPVINSDDLGKITENVHEVLIEVTGTAHETVLNTLTTVAISLADRGGQIYSATIQYPYAELKNVVTPQLKTKTMQLDTKFVNKVLGFDLKTKEIVDLLQKARFGIGKVSENNVSVEIPCYRMDIMHPIDIVEDVAIAYGYNNIKPRWPKLPTIGSASPQKQFSDLVREIMIGLGFQEILTFSMSNPETLFNKMSLKVEKVVEISNPKMATFTCLRNWLLPSLMEFLSHNTHVEYPQRIFEAGYATIFDKKKENKTRNIQKLACASIHANANFTEVKAVLDALFLNLGLEYDIREDQHASFIEGRIGKILVKNEEIGVIGEIHPKILEVWKLENPASAFEIDLEEIYKHACMHILE
jgi:phenylalanyl-tRNA synthetase beta chain